MVERRQVRSRYAESKGFKPIVRVAGEVEKAFIVRVEFKKASVVQMLCSPRGGLFRVEQKAAGVVAAC